MNESDYDARLDTVRRSIDWRKELAASPSLIPGILFAGEPDVRSTCRSYLTALKVAPSFIRDDVLALIYRDEIDGLLDHIASAIDVKVTIPFAWEEKVRAAFHEWRDERAAEIVKEEGR